VRSRGSGEKRSRLNNFSPRKRGLTKEGKKVLGDICSDRGERTRRGKTFRGRARVLTLGYIRMPAHKKDLATPVCGRKFRPGTPSSGRKTITSEKKVSESLRKPCEKGCGIDPM